MKKFRFKLHKDECILTAYAENCAGPGWVNTLIWILIRQQDPNGGYKLRTESLQWEEMTPHLKSLLPISALISEQMLSATNGYFKDTNKYLCDSFERR